jgi:hypothetical protein
MHHSSPEIQALFRRFLSALFGVSSETVDDLRYNDAGNRRHLNLFPPSLVKQWADGKTSSGKLLPGYTDPQTLFMLGEDCNTCMSIRARQKGTNRGLLSILLQGNIRVVGAKDSSGRLVTRSVVRLVLDDATKMPVLYVDTPYGNLDDEDSLLQVRALPTACGEYFLWLFTCSAQSIHFVENPSLTQYTHLQYMF